MKKFNARVWFIREDLAREDLDKRRAAARKKRMAVANAVFGR